MFIHRHSTRLITGIIPFPKSDTIFQTPNTMLLDISTAITSDASFLHIPTFLSYDKLLLSWLTVSPFPPLPPIIPLAQSRIWLTSSHCSTSLHFS